MPIYTYKGYDAATGIPKKGKVEADSLKAARSKLRTKEKIIPSEIKEQASVNSTGTNFLTRAKVPTGDLVTMTRQFATLQMAQVPLDECLKALTEQVENPALKNVLSGVKESVSEGKSLGDALAVYPTVFDRLFVNMVRAGESSGSLGLVLERLAGFLEYQQKVQGEVMGAMAYPAIMIGAASLIIVYLFVSVVPKLQKIFVSMKVNLPWYSKLLIGFSDFLQTKGYVLVAAGVAGYFLFRSWVTSEKGRSQFDKFQLGLPLFGSVILKLNVSKFTKTLSTLLNSGVPIIQALEITRNVVSNKVISDVLIQAKQSVQEGESLGAVIERSGRFPPLVSHMIKTGEKTGELEKMLQHVSESYDSEIERTIGALISLIEPLMIIVMGGIVVVVVIGMLMPMLSIMNAVH